MNSGIGTYHGPRRDVPFDRWFRYPAGFNQQALEWCFEAVGVAPRDLIVDPFAGASTVGTGSLIRGMRFRGIEAHPLIARLGQLKLTLPPTEDPQRALIAVCRPTNVEVNEEHPLVVKCFDGATLAFLSGVRQRLDTGAGGAWTPWLTCALLATLRDVAIVSVGWPYQRPARPRQAVFRDVQPRLEERFHAILDDLRKVTWSREDGSVVPGDARLKAAWQAALGGEPARACISSPPYLNNFDYADATRLEVFFLGEASTWRELCERFRQDMLVATTQQSSVGQRAAHLNRIRTWGPVGDRIADLVRRLTVERCRRPRGKEYDASVAGYFVGVDEVLERVRDALLSQSRVAWVIGDSAPYGVFVDTPALVGQIAERHGFEVIEDRVLRQRGRRWRTNGSRHQVALAERLLVLQRK